MLKANNAVELGRQGGKKGGKARAAVMTPEQRSEAARTASLARWSAEKGVRLAPYASELNLGGMILDCAVLDDGTRVLSQRAVSAALSRYRPGGRGTDPEGTGGMPKFLSAKNLQTFVSDELRAAVMEDIRYRAYAGGQPAQGIRAELLPKICQVWMEAKRANVLKPQQERTAQAAEILVVALAQTGIIALVDEATGFQYVRAYDALAQILEQFIAKELAGWVKTFDDDYYRELFRLRGRAYSPKQRPKYFGKLTNDLIYERLAPGVLSELKRLNPPNQKGNRRHKHFQRLTSNVGYPKLKQHLGKVTALMQISKDWTEFMNHLDRIAPRQHATLVLPHVDLNPHPRTPAPSDTAVEVDVFDADGLEVFADQLDVILDEDGLSDEA
jgi:P63C domain